MGREAIESGTRDAALGSAALDELRRRGVIGAKRRSAADELEDVRGQVRELTAELDELRRQVRELAVELETARRRPA